MTEPSTARYRAAELVDFAAGLFRVAGLEEEKARTVAEVLLEGDLLGHTTHGLALTAPYLQALADGSMTREGAPDVVSERGGAVCWDGRRLPGPWLVVRAIEAALARVPEHGLAAVAIRESHHIACLAAYLERATAEGCMILLTCSDPSEASVAPFGGRAAVFTPDPIAVGIPTAGEPILIDMSASITTNGMTARLRGQGKRFPGPWAMTAEGEASDDPNVLFTQPPGTLLPTGGLDHGHKGYNLALTIEALSQGLSGHGRADPLTGWGASVYVQVMDPAAFGGAADFIRQTSFVAEACRSNPPAPGGPAVRLPGQQGLARKREALSAGVRLHPGIMEQLGSWAGKLAVAEPAPLA
ncbi:MAG TPA: Ldh family oxidoreductase [Geminicoccaceae bacterium]|nr:Ldh family oxidoreductase [Geminicoccaceae bacterium]